MKLVNLLKMTAETKIHYMIMDKSDYFTVADFTVDYLDKDCIRLSDSILKRQKFEKTADVEWFGINSLRKCLEIRCTI